MPEELEYPPPPFTVPTQEISPAVWLIVRSPWKAWHSIDVLPAIAAAALKVSFKLTAWEFEVPEKGHYLTVNGDLWSPGEEVQLTALNTPFDRPGLLVSPDGPVVPDDNGRFSRPYWLPFPKGGTGGQKGTTRNRPSSACRAASARKRWSRCRSGGTRTRFDDVVAPGEGRPTSRATSYASAAIGLWVTVVPDAPRKSSNDEERNDGDGESGHASRLPRDSGLQTPANLTTDWVLATEANGHYTLDCNFAKA